ncbi:DUF1003 domain-containing protein [Novosphingobium lentum]|uniref:DUF1003 domain-containing protein n=1 Tax=Novosphingobium lentum TaxID=145287 RepID=UPI0008325ABF|nr:DUF1003 domain-containing protein [Novosphingobium lentum]
MKPEADPEALAEELLGRPFCDLDPEEQRVLERIASGNVIGMDSDEAAAATSSPADHLADRVAAVGGSWGFIIFFTVVLVVWMALNGSEAAGWIKPWDPYPYILLNLVLSTIAALQAPVIMMSQNRLSKKDRITARHDYEVNLRTQLEIIRLHRKFDKVLAIIGQAKREASGGPGVNDAD